MSKGNEWTEDVTVKMLGDNGDVLSQSLCNGVPMQRNRVTNVAGYFLSGGASGNIILDDSWSDTYQFDFWQNKNAAALTGGGEKQSNSTN